VCPRGVASAGNQEPQIEGIDPDFFDNETIVPNGRSRPVSGWMTQVGGTVLLPGLTAPLTWMGLFSREQPIT